MTHGRREEGRFEPMGPSRGERNDRGRTGDERGGRSGRVRGRGRGGRPSFDDRGYGGAPPDNERYHQQPQAQMSPVSGRALPPIQPGKDEFGRDLPESGREGENKAEDGGGEEDMALDDSDDEDIAAPTISIAEKPENSTTHSTTLPSPPLLHQALPSSIAGSSFAPTTDRATLPQNGLPNFSNASTLMKATLETFDISSFNPADPTSWTALAEAFQNSTGKEPNQMDIMQFLAGQTVGAQDANEPSLSRDAIEYGEYVHSVGDGRGRGMNRGRGRARGRGGY